MEERRIRDLLTAVCLIILVPEHASPLLILSNPYESYLNRIQTLVIQILHENSLLEIPKIRDLEREEYKIIKD